MAMIRIFIVFFISSLFYTTLAVSAPALAAPRDPTLLLNQFYGLKENHPQQALLALEILLQQYPDNVVALKEMGYWQLAHHLPETALPYFIRAYNLQPDAQLALQIAYIDINLNNKTQARDYLQQALDSHQQPFANQAQLALQNIPASPPPTPIPVTLAAAAPTMPAPTMTAQKPIMEIVSSLSTQLNQFYALQKTDPVAAEKLLAQLIASYPDNVTLLNQMAYLQLANKHVDAALTYFGQSYNLHKDPALALQMGYLLFAKKQYESAMNYFQDAVAIATDNSMKKKAEMALDVSKKTLAMNMAGKQKIANIQPTPATPESLSDKLLNEYYQTKKTNPAKAESILLQLVQAEPDNAIAIKELAYQYYAEKNYDQAYIYFLKELQLTHDLAIAAQLGYLLDATDHKRAAYHYFQMATHSPDPVLSLKSEQALINLGGWNTKVLPDPFFADIYLAPLYYGRFAMMVYPLAVRAGVYLDHAHRAEAYTFFRYTKDNRSGIVGVSPEIFEDDDTVTGVGLRYLIFQTFPVYAYAEVGAAYDLIYRDRPLWRGDFRTGFNSFAGWGRKPVFQPELKFPFKPVGDFYGDLSYYTRYQGDIIGTARVRQGLRIAEFHNSYIDVYLKGQLGIDSLHQFYNNYLELGPGIAFVPDNHYNFAIRLESITGYYIPVDSPSVNPYGSRYHTNNIQLELYARF